MQATEKKEKKKEKNSLFVSALGKSHFYRDPQILHGNISQTAAANHSRCFFQAFSNMRGKSRCPFLRGVWFAGKKAHPS
jgi:hypothetical protein